MITKTFRAKNMLMALQQVQEEFGPDAMVLSMREVPSGPVWAAWRKPCVEIIATKNTANASKLKVNTLPEKNEKPTSEELKLEIEKLKLAFSGIDNNQNLPIDKVTNLEEKGSVDQNAKKTKFDSSDFIPLPENDLINESKEIKKTRTPLDITSKSKEDLSVNLQEIKDLLLDQGVENNIVESIVNTNQDSLSPAIKNNFPRLSKYMMHQLSANLVPLKRSLALIPSKVMVLIGTSGSGKTSTCAKIAAQYKLKFGKKVVWIEADTIKTSAISEARTFSESLDIPFFLSYTPQELSELINSQNDADLILIDTPSVNPRIEDKVVELASFLSVTPVSSIYLVSSATTKVQDLIETEKTFHQFGLKGLIITKVDETGTFGSIYNLVVKSKLPIFFFTSGTSVFDDLVPGDHEKLVSAIFEESFPKERG